MTTLNDVAKRANVSKMTVSRVINHPEQVTDELKQLVFKAMKELDYRPNIAAKALVHNRSQIIKLFILEKIDTTEPYYMNLLMGIAKFLDQKFYSLQLVTKNGYDLGSCDGYIITGVRENDFEWISRLEKPVILFGENEHGFDFVDSDNCYGTQLTTKHALERGYEEVVFIGIDVDEPFERSREQGYLAVMAAHGLKPTIHRFGNHSGLSEQFIRDNWQEFADRSICFVCASDRLAIGIERAVLSCGGALPAQFGVIGFDGVFLDQIGSPKLTTAKQDILKMGEACAELLIKKIEEDGQAQGSKRFLPKLIVRDSTK